MIGVSNKWSDMEAKAIKPIKQYRLLVKNYNACKELYESLYPSITSTIKTDVVMTLGGNSAEDKMINILDHRAHCRADLYKQKAFIDKIEETVKSLPPDEQFIIRRYYMSEQRVNMEEIAEELHAGVQSCWRWRRKAVQKLVEKMIVNDSETEL